jgi:hypothetical protein
MNSRNQSTSGRLVHVLALTLLALDAGATPQDWTPVAPSALAGMRGGFTLAHGLHLSVGIEQLVAINGVTVGRAELTLLQGDGGNTSLGAAAGLRGMLLVQNGSVQAMPVGFSPDLAGGMLIQNSLNDQSIGSQTIINASVNSGALLDTINFQGQLSDALARAAAAR